MDVFSIITSFIGICSLLGVIYQGYQLYITIGNQIYQSFINNSVTLDKILIQYPELRKYVYDNEPVDDETDDIDRIVSTIELIIDITENISVYKKYIPRNRRQGWLKFVSDVEKTHAYHYYMRRHGEWYIVR